MDQHLRPRGSRRWLAGLLPAVLAAASLPLLAPTCGDGQPGVKTFARNSLVIPMDVCYQCTAQDATFNTATANCTRTGYTSAPTGNACPQALDPGDVVKAYGLVYQLIRNDIAVYWVIEPGKTAVDGHDLAIQYDGGFPVLHYDWATGRAGTPPTQGNVARYMGGPFVVDGSDYDRASAVLQRFRSTFGSVNVHVAQVAFQGSVRKTMAGGWSAGGAVPPKLALLDIGSGNITSRNPLTVTSAKNSEPVIEAYLTRAGIGSGTAAGTSRGPHGEIYDSLGIADFQPDASGDWRTSSLGRLGYQILWVPHWVAPGSCSDFSSNTACAGSFYPRTQVDQSLRTIGAFVASGRDLFAECAGLGSFEGVLNSSGVQVIDYEDGDPSTRLQSTTGMRINQRAPGTPLYDGDYESPLLQVGDFPFRPVDGAIKIYKPAAAYVGGATPLVVRLVSDQTDPTLDYFTLLPGTTGATPRGTVVYLAGHSYSGTQGAFQIAGTRLVLNTLFNLGAGCTESGVTCDTGQLGVCAKGVLSCGPDGQPVCSQSTTASTEVCNGLDDDCDGLVDEGLETACYGGAPSTRGVGVCRDGVRACVQNPDGSWGLSACAGEVLPAEEVCNALDDDCDGQADESLQQACYFGPPGSLDANGVPRGVCKPGLQTCSAGSWGTCRVCAPGETAADCQILPAPEEICSEGGAPSTLDDDCDGQVNESCGCTPGQTQVCYGGPAGSLFGACRTGVQTCTADRSWSACEGEVVPSPEVCANGVDEDCDGVADDDPVCSACPPESDPARVCRIEGVARDPGTGAPRGICRDGVRACAAGVIGACEGQVLPAPETCDGEDNDCDGTPDDGATCGAGFACVHGVCVPSTCGVENPCPEGYECADVDAGAPVVLACVRDTCGGVTCPDGDLCQFGACVDPCAGVTCGDGATCASGSCTGGSCYAAGCPAGQVCRDGVCQPSACEGVTCPVGTFCRGGDCVQSCAFVTCPAGQRCGADGFCEADACAATTCPPAQRCVAGACVADPCASVACGRGQACAEGRCVDDPCAGVDCPVGACLGGQCFAAAQAQVESPPSADGGGGCGCGTSEGAGLAALFLLALAPLARRRPAPAPARAGRGRAAARLLVLALAALGLSACQEDPEEPFDPTACAATCGETRCVDVAFDPSHCGACGSPCEAGSRCVEGFCGPASAVAPFVRSASPPSGPRGALTPVTVTLAGERFRAGATVRVTSPSGTVTVPATVLDAGRVTAELDLAGSSGGELRLRVVNPDRVISNAVRFDVVTPSPVIEAIAPASTLVGATAGVRVTGTGFTSATTCRISGALVLEQGLPTSSTVDGAIVCTVAGGAFQPGAYRLWVVNEGLSSNQVDFRVDSAVPHVDALSPATAVGGPGAQSVALTVTGTGFDRTSVVLFDGIALSSLFVDSTQLFVPALPLAGVALGEHVVRVRNGAVQSDPVPFFVAGSVATIATFEPFTAFQNDTVTLRFTGTGFAAGTRIQAQPPSCATPPCPFADLATTLGGTTSAQATYALAGAPEGAHAIRLAYPDGGASTVYTLRVLSNTAILRGASPQGGAQGETPSVVLTASNLREPRGEIRVRFAGPGIAARTLVPSAIAPPAPSAPTQVTVAIPLASLDTGAYTLAVLNPAASPSNTLGFNVTPGPPQVTTACLGDATPCVSSAPRQDAPVTLVVRGANFAKPVGGAGGSLVHVAAPELGVTDFVFPAADTTVVSHDRIEVRVDTRAGLPGTYDLSVWSPGGPTPPQKSNVLPDALRITP
jgi:hypothetical protein